MNKKLAFVAIIPLATIVIISVISQVSDSYIPPTRAFDRIITANGTLEAKNSSSPLYLTGFNGIITSNNLTNTLVISSSGIADLVHATDVSRAFSSIGTNFEDIFIQTNSDGKSFIINSTGFTKIRTQILWNHIGLGTATVRVVETTNSSNVIASFNVDDGSNDSGWIDIPSCCKNIEKKYKLQAKSTNVLDAPIFEGARIWLR